MEVPVVVSGKGASGRRVVRVGEPSTWDVSGLVTIDVGGFGWLPTSHVVDLGGGGSREVVLDIEPRAVLRGRVLDALDSTPIASFGLRVESALGQPGLGSQTYVGSRQEILTPDGGFCQVQVQEARSHRITIDAEGYETHRAEWRPVVPGRPIDVGDILLLPVVTRPLPLLVVDAESGTPVADAAVLVTTNPLAPTDLVLAGDRIAPGPSLDIGGSEERSARTDGKGSAHISVPVGKRLWIAAWRTPYELEIVEHPPVTGEAGIPSLPVSVQLSRGARIEGIIGLGPDLQAVVRQLDIEVRGHGARRQIAVDLVEPLDAIPFEMGGLEPGQVELWVVAREEGGGQRVMRTLIASQSLWLSASETSYLEIDCGLAFGDGVVRGSVWLPPGVASVAVRAFASTDRNALVARRTVPVREGHFVLSGCDAPRTIVGIQGADDSGAVQMAWIGEVNGMSNPNLSIDLSRSTVRGHAGDLSHLPMEEVVVTPGNGSPLSGIALATVTAYPADDGEFTIHGLPPGPYRAVAVNAGLRAEFEIGSESVDVYLTESRSEDR